MTHKFVYMGDYSLTVYSTNILYVLYCNSLLYPAPPKSDVVFEAKEGTQIILLVRTAHFANKTVYQNGSIDTSLDPLSFH